MLAKIEFQYVVRLRRHHTSDETEITRERLYRSACPLDAITSIARMHYICTIQTGELGAMM